MDNNSSNIEIKIHDEKKQVIIEVVDSGEGMNDIDMIFEPLYTTKQIGIGLGLVICRNIIDLHGGKITAKNNPTTFTISLPKMSIR